MDFACGIARNINAYLFRHDGLFHRWYLLFFLWVIACALSRNSKKTFSVCTCFYWLLFFPAFATETCCTVLPVYLAKHGGGDEVFMIAVFLLQTVYDGSVPFVVFFIAHTLCELSIFPIIGVNVPWRSDIKNE